MGTKQENKIKRDARIAKMGEQIRSWSTQLDDLVVSYLEAGAQPHDEYRQRVDTLRERCGTLQAKYDEFNAPGAEGEPWGAFRTSIADDWAAVDDGLKDLTH